MVGLLAAVGTTLCALASLIHGVLILAVIVGAGAATGLAAFLALPSSKKNRTGFPDDSVVCQVGHGAHAA
jgi:hypothetical protein